LERLRQLHRASAPGRDWLVELSTPHHPDAGERLFARYGFRPERYFFLMKAVLNPSSPRPIAAAPEGMRVAAPPDGLERALHEACSEAFEDHWGYESAPFDQWRAMMLDSPGYRPELSRLVFDGEEIAAFTLSHIMSDGHVYVAHVGTRRRWRKRGLAS